MSDHDPSPPSRVPWPPLLFVTLTAVGIILNLLWPVPLWPGHRLWIGGVALIVFAAALSVWAHHALAKAHTTIRPDRASSSLVTDGPFGWTRNPLYVSLCAVSAGVALLVNGLFPLLMTVLLALALNYIVIPKEERHLRLLFPKEYEQYAQRVRRWL